MKLIFSVLLTVFITVSGSSQSLRLGYINADSLLLLMPGYAAQMDTVHTFRMKIDTAISFMQEELNRKIATLDSTRYRSSALMIAVQELEINKEKERVSEFQRAMMIELEQEKQKRTKPFREKLAAASKEVGTRKGCQAVYNDKMPALCWSADKVEVLDLTALVAVELGLGKR